MTFVHHEMDINRNNDKILRVIKALQAQYRSKFAIHVNRQPGDSGIVPRPLKIEENKTWYLKFEEIKN